MILCGKSFFWNAEIDGKGGETVKFVAINLDFLVN